MRSCRLFILRHGQTVWNVEQRIQGHRDSPLTEHGRQQVEQLGRRLGSESFAALYCSDLRRAIESLRPLADAVGMKPVLDVRLRERNLGVLEGLTANEGKETQPEAWQGFKANDPDYRIPDGESSRMLHQRVREVVHELAARHPGQQVALMGHGGTLNHVLRICLSLPLDAPRAFSTLNASVNVVDYVEGRFVLHTWGDVSHLRSVVPNTGSLEVGP